MAMGMASGVSANAKILEPEIIYTDTWTSNYYIDGDFDTPYPYLDCNLRIYNNGTVEVDFWNTHEFDSFQEFAHKVTAGSYPLVDNGINFNNYIYTYDSYTCKVIDKVNNYVFNTFPKGYKVNYTYGAFKDYNSYYDSLCFKNLDNPRFMEYTKSSYGGTSSFSVIGTETPLGKFGVNSVAMLKFTPTTEPVGTYNFHIFGKDFSVSRDNLAAELAIESSPAKDTITQLQTRISNLEQENRTLYEQLEIYLPHEDNSIEGDIDGNGVLDARDASMLLTFYARQSVGDPITLGQLIEEQKGQ
jgi:hypothetical protein